MRQSTGTKLQKSYEEPALKKLTPEQAKKFLLHHANMGDQGAKDLIEVAFPSRKEGGRNPAPDCP
jgi:hypothetical protein